MGTIVNQWEFQDPKMEVLKAIFSGDIPLHRPYIGLTNGRYLQFRFLKWPLTSYESQPPSETLVDRHFQLRIPRHDGIGIDEPQAVQQGAQRHGELLLGVQGAARKATGRGGI